MKFKLFDRILLTLYTIVILLLSLGMAGIAIGLISINDMTDFLSTLEYGWSFALITLGIAALFLLTSLRLLLSGFSRNKPTSSLLKTTDLGAILVSISTLDALAQKAVRSFTEVKDVKSIVLTETEGIKVRLKVTIMPDVKMPELTQSIQDKVKEYIENLSGISVIEVRVYIDNLLTPQRNRVE